MSFAPRRFSYKNYAFQLYDIDEITLPVSKFKIIKCTYRAFSIKPSSLKEIYDFLESLPINDEFKVYFNVKYLMKSKLALSRWTLHEIRPISFIKNNTSAMYINFYFVEEKSFLDAFNDLSQYNVNFLTNLNHITYNPDSVYVTIDSKDYGIIKFSASVILRVSTHKLCEIFPIYEISSNITMTSNEKIPENFIRQIIGPSCIHIYEKFIQSKMQVVANSEIRYSKIFFIEKCNNIQFDSKLYMYPKYLMELDLAFFNPRTPIFNSISYTYESANELNLIPFIINSSYIPMTKLSIPVKIEKIRSGFNQFSDSLEFIETKIVYRELILDKNTTVYNTYNFGKNKYETQKIYFTFYRDLIHKFNGQEFKYSIFRRKLLQKWNDIEVDFVVDGPVTYTNDKNGISLFHDLIKSSIIFSKYTWIFVASYIIPKDKSLRFVAVAIHNDVAKQKFKDLTISEGGITPFWISS